jgi:SNF2 family DNA or RNA helicase
VPTTAEITTERPNRITVGVDYRLKESVKKVPGARWDTEAKVWTVPLSWPACLALRAEFGTGGLVIGKRLGEWAKWEKLRKKNLTELRDVINEVPLGLGDFTDTTLPGFDVLFDYQRVGAALIVESDGYLILDATGTGKTRTALAGIRMAIEYSETEDEILPCLIVAPKSMLQTWGRETANFFPDHDVRVVEGTPAKLKAKLEPGADFYVINYEGLRKYSRVSAYGSVALKEGENEDKEIQALGLRSVIADEVHRAKSPKAAQTRALWAASADVNLRVGMTGTPVQDTPEDLWALLRFIAPSEYPTKTAYMERFCDVQQNYWGGVEVRGLNPLTKEEFFANFDARSRRVTKDMALPFLPPKLYETRWVTLPTKLRKPYAEMEKLLEAELLSGVVLTAGSVLERANRLLSMANASGTPETITKTDDEGNVVESVKYVMEMPSPKVEAFMEDVKAGDFDGQQVAVFSDSRQLIDLLDVEMTKAKLTFGRVTGGEDSDARQKAVDDFQRGDLPFILLTRAGGEGITLTAASVMVRLVRPWSLTIHTQVEDRIHRIGSERHESVLYIDYITEGTVEEKQVVALNAKGERAEEILRDAETLLKMLRRDADA